LPDYDAHALSGIVTYPLAVLLSSYLSWRLGLPELTENALVLGYAFYVLGSLLPDLDHPDSVIHRGTKPIVSVSIGSVLYLWSRTLEVEPAFLAPALHWGIGALGALVGWYVFTWLMPRHRGVVHSLLFALIYAIIAFFTVSYGLKLGTGPGLHVGLSAFLGYSLHLLLDRSIKAL